MKYKGFVIKPVYYCGSDFKVLKDGTIKDRKPTSKDIEYYEIIDDDGDRWIAENTIQECKDTIDAFLGKCKEIDSKF
jgi:hypothetical protein